MRTTDALNRPRCGFPRPPGSLTSIFAPEGDRLLALYEAEDRYFGRMLGVGYAEIFRSASPLLLRDPTVILPGVHG